MRSKILDAIAKTQNNDPLSLLNTAIDIEVDWDASLVSKNNNVAELEISINSIKGTYSYSEHRSGYEKITTIKFSTNSDWKIDIDTKSVTFPLSPASAEINVYSKTLKLYF
jgi:hypothetical protein